MAPDNSDEERSSDQLDPEPQTDSETKAVEAALKAKSRRRTKTGCLTCRRRRIKCGEERPICRNCVKSKRHCEGYNQRVIFKPTFDYRPSPHGGAHITFQAGPFPGPIAPVVELMPPTIDLQQYNRLTSRPPEPFIPAFGMQTQQLAAFEQHMVALSMPPAHPMEADSRQSPHYPIIVPPRPLSFHPAPLPHSTIHNEQTIAMALHPACITSDSVSYGTPSVASSSVHDDIPPTFVHALGDPSSVRLAYEHQQSRPKAGSLPPQLPSQPPLVHDPNLDGFVRSRPWIDTNFAHIASSDLITPPSSHSSRAFSSGTPVSLSQQPWTTGTLIPSFEPSQPVDLHLSPTSTGRYYPAQYTAAPPPYIQSDPSTPYGFEQDVQFPVNASPNYLLTSAAIETQDDDYYDVLPQEEMDDVMTSSDARLSDRHHNTLSNLLAIAQIALPGSQMRRYDTFIYHGILDHYHVEWVANPLKNPATARVFAHFISVTGPSLSIYERHSRNASVLFARGAVPFAQQGLWTYTMPMAALHHQGLLHAMLALASLHIARLQGASTTPSMQHYAWSLKRIHQCVGHEKKRLQLTTIAASMLLGFYEVMAAEHMKWNMHLAGSKQLYIETDFTKMTQEFRRMKLDRLARGKQRVSDEGRSAQDEILDQMPDVDDHMVSHMVGREVRYGITQGSIEIAQTTVPRRLNLSEFASLRDLYWWYCRQDAIQSIVSGNALLMDYGRWSNCSPRAPLGRADAVYGSFDHLILLLGRIADFAARDRTRKLKQMEANGGQWRPTPGMKISRPPSQQQQNPPPTPVSATSSRNGGINAFLRPSSPIGKRTATNTTMPAFYGMAPPPRATVQMPASYMPLEPTPISRHETEDLLQSDLQAATDAALREYGQIRAALLTFSNSLGDAFEPLTSDYHPAKQTPFGSALFYRAYDIGCLWGFYNMAMIIAIRSHPHMPPAAHAAAGVAAQETAFFANEIGRITAGIVPGSRHEPLNPSLGAALNESCLPSFFAAVQYRDPAQRHFTVTRIFNIAQRTGWGTAELIANGCETAWIRAAEAGRGPPYERIMRSHSSNKDDPRLNGSWESLDPWTAPNEKDEADRRQVRTNAQARLNWAIGVMGLEADVGMAEIEE